MAALVVVGASASGASAKGPLHWSKAIHVGHQGIDAIGCPSTKLCVAGSSDGLLVSTEPSGPASSWQLVFVPPTSGNMGPQVTSVSCPSASFCAAVTLNGDLLTSTDPTGGTSAWKLTSLHMPTGLFPNAFIPQVSCASASLCVAISTGSKKVFSSADPGGGGARWHTINLGRPLQTLACTAPKLCVLGDDRGNVRTSTNPTGGARGWTFAHIFGKPGFVEDLHAAACGSEHWCMISAISGGADVLIQATRPTVTSPATRGAWQDQVGVSLDGFISGSCVGKFCAYASTDGVVYFPTGSFRTLTQTRVYRPGHRGPNQGTIDCVSARWCALATLQTGDVYIGTR